ncbi:MAG: Glu/Leu/Phe/Val dehydrogenase [Deltaproteobacteria bacterium]|nr:Glu/Leu/Phe/Val dehydrogenase [Deltaproteobacteria bacterium]
MVQLTEVTERFAEAAGCDTLYLVTDEASGLHAYIALHTLERGPGYGGVRRRVFPDVHAAVHEVVGLAEQMTLKTAFAGLPAGGAKGVILDRPDGHTAEDTRARYRAFGTAIEMLGGTFFAGPDVGTSENELAVLRETTCYVSTVEAHPSRSTAIGVVAGCRAAMAHLALDPATMSAAVVGVGSVGSEVARRLAALGMRLVISDIVPARVEAVAAELGAAIAAPDAVPDADLLVPCALGNIVTAANLGALRARVICGAANHQLETTTLAHDLEAMDILYVPDFAANAGAVIEGVLRRTAPAGADVEALVAAALDAIGERTSRMLALAEEADITPLEAALMMIDEGQP